MRIKLFILLLFCLVKVQAQETAWSLNSDSLASVVVPAQYTRILYDTDQALTFSEIQSERVQQWFQPGHQKKKRIYPGVYWFNYAIRNNTARPVQIALTSDARYAAYYLKGVQGAWEEKLTGQFQPWHRKDGFRQMSGIPYLLQPNEVLHVYQRNNYWEQIPEALNAVILFPQVMAREQFSKAQETAVSSLSGNQLLSALISGILLFAAIIYIRFYWIVQIRFYLYYALFLFAFALMYSPVPLLIQVYPLVNVYVSYFSFGTGLFFFSQFIRSYLRTHANYRWWDLWLITASVLPLGFFIINYVFAGLLPPSAVYYTITWGNWSFILLLDSLLITTILYLFSRKASPGIIATIPALLLWGAGQSYRIVASALQPDNPEVHASGFIKWMHENNYLIDLLCIVWIVSVFSSLLFQRFQHLQKKLLKEAVKNERLKRQKEQERLELIARQNTELEQKVDERTKELKRSNRELVTAMRNLKATQRQLIQSEKMASLGELTAGVAHEIQNPLNFINNFSEVSTELAQEIESALQENDKEAALAAVNEMKESLEKIANHGRRADSIVKGMLQHSRGTSGSKEPVNINSLVDEYLRLSFHGLRAKDKDFNASFSTHLDEAIGDVEVVPQDIGRVLLNLFNNAFYAVNEKKKMLNGSYEPEVFVRTKKTGDKIEITVKDNGTGIPAKVVEKIYQPFFTTKPTGQGTGLGLSLSYDIITKGHSGEMLVESSEGEGAEFKIILPAKTKRVNSTNEII